MNDQGELAGVWVFNGIGGRYPAAVFSTKERAEEWINRTGVLGILTRYQLDISAYDWSVSQSIFTPSDPSERQPAFIQQFTSAAQEHYHYERDDDDA